MQKKSQKTVVEKISFGFFKKKPNCYIKTAVIKTVKYIESDK